VDADWHGFTKKERSDAGQDEVCINNTLGKYDFYSKIY